MDRATIDVDRVQQAKKIRRVLNAKAKKIMIEQEQKLKKFVNAVEKINKIHEVVAVKYVALPQRK